MAAERLKRIRVVAVGSALRGDDGVGPAVLERLRGRDLPENVMLVDAGGDPLDAAAHVLDSDKVIIIDAADMSLSPGAIRVLSPEQLRLSPVQHPFSTHGFGVAEGLELARAAGFNPEISIIGVQPEMENLDGCELSPAVAAGIPEVVKIVLEEVAS